jgi:hypothetical protein
VLASGRTFRREGRKRQQPVNAGRQPRGVMHVLACNSIIPRAQPISNENATTTYPLVRRGETDAVGVMAVLVSLLGRSVLIRSLLASPLDRRVLVRSLLTSPLDRRVLNRSERSACRCCSVDLASISFDREDAEGAASATGFEGLVAAVAVGGDVLPCLFSRFH